MKYKVNGKREMYIQDYTIQIRGKRIQVQKPTIQKIGSHNMGRVAKHTFCFTYFPKESR